MCCIHPFHLTGRLMRRGAPSSSNLASNVNFEIYLRRAGDKCLERHQDDTKYGSSKKPRRKQARTRKNGSHLSVTWVNVYALRGLCAVRMPRISTGCLVQMWSSHDITAQVNTFSLNSALFLFPRESISRANERRSLNGPHTRTTMFAILFVC